uniref:Methyltransferase-like protein 15 n=2 Tax=Arion vulgaris TaxID=1028688 RepID=A0A0B7AHX3_9EUPU
MFVPNRCFGQGILKFFQAKSPHVDILSKKGHKRRGSLLCVVEYSHTAAVFQKDVKFSKLKNHCISCTSYKSETYKLSGKTRGLVTSVPDAELEKDNLSFKDNHELDTVSSSEEQENVSSQYYEKSSCGKHKAKHVPVMVNEVLQILQPKNGQIIVDMTFGAGGHAKEILKAAPDVRYFASDRDPLANSIAIELASEHSQSQITPILSRFSEIPIHLHQHGIEPGSVDSFLFDLGASSMQFDMSERGFSLSRDGPLDMRMDGDRFPDSPTAADIVNNLDPQDLAHIFKKYGEERKSLQIAHALVEARYAFGNFTRTKQLADVILTTFNSGAFRQDKLSHHAHVATKCFQALRIFVNNELNEIHNGLEIARHYLKPQGCCVVISFHSLEDRIVKRHFLDIDIDETSNMSIHDHFRNAEVSFDVKTIQEEFMAKVWQPLSRKVMESSEEECYKNPRARSAKLRAALKL